MAVQIIEIQSNRLCINTDAFGEILDRAGDRPVAIVSVNGPMRSGKSYMINHFLRYLTSAPEEDWFHRVLPKEFHWKNSSERQTTGLMVWPEPLVVQRDGREVAILLVDTQGCFDDKTTLAENSLLFAFSCLISSDLVFNFKNQISEDVLQFLQLFVGHARAIVDLEDRDSLTRLILLIRDWQFPDDFPFGVYDDVRTPSGGHNFKTEKLDVRPEMAPESRAVRQELASSFQKISCSLMPYPGNELAQHDRSDNLDPQFVLTIREVVPQIFAPKSGFAKRVGSEEVTGSQLKQLVLKWAELFAGNDIPAVQSVADATAELQNANASRAALMHYRDGMTSALQSHNGLPVEELDRIHAAKMQEAVTAYQQAKRIAHPGVQQKFLEELNGDIERSFGQFRDMNDADRRLREEQEAAAQRLREEQEAAAQRLREEQEAAERRVREAQEAEAREAEAQRNIAAEVERTLRHGVREVERVIRNPRRLFRF